MNTRIPMTLGMAGMLLVATCNCTLAVDEPSINELKARAEKGDPKAQLDLANAFANGIGVPQSYEQAAALLQKAAAQGNIDAKFALGKAYHNALGVKRSYRKAFALLREAAEGGNAEAQEALVICYLYGFGVPCDTKEATKWAYRRWSDDSEEARKIRKSFGSLSEQTEQTEFEWYCLSPLDHFHNQSTPKKFLWLLGRKVPAAKEPVHDYWEILLTPAADGLRVTWKNDLHGFEFSFLFLDKNAIETGALRSLQACLDKYLEWARIATSNELKGVSKRLPETEPVLASGQFKNGKDGNKLLGLFFRTDDYGKPSLWCQYDESGNGYEIRHDRVELWRYMADATPEVVEQVAEEARQRADEESRTEEKAKELLK